MLETKNIPFIHNYCDRWCERCAFTSRCSVFEAEQEMSDEEQDIQGEVFWQNLSDVFAQTKQMLTEKAEEFGIDINAINDEEFADQLHRDDEIVNNADLTKLTRQYALESENF